MCVHGYPAGKSIFCLQLESRVTEITKRCDTSHADTYEDDVSVACAARCSLAAQYVPCSSFLGDNTRFLSRDTVCQFSSNRNRPSGSALVMFLRARRWPVGASACE